MVKMRYPADVMTWHESDKTWHPADCHKLVQVPDDMVDIMRSAGFEVLPANNAGLGGDMPVGLSGTSV